MSRLPGFCGASNRAYSVNVNAERSVNYLVQREAGTPVVDPTLRGRPGVNPFVQIGTGPHRACFQQDGLAWVVSGGLFVEIFAGGSSTTRGFVVVDGNPATICSNGGADGSGGHQLLITSGGRRYLYDLVSQAFVEIVTPDTPGPWLMGIYINGFFLTLQSNGDKIYFSDLLNGANSSWEPLNVLQVFQQPGNIAAIIASHNEMWPFSATSVNPWVGTSESSTFIPVPGASIEYGIFAPWSLLRLENTLYWLSQTEQGGALVVRAEGYSPKIISTPAVNTSLQRIPNLQAAVGFTLQIEGHTFYGLYTANHDTTWLYDLSTDTWVEWATWWPDTDRFTPFNCRTHVFAFGKHLVGAIDSGWLYELTFEATTDTLKAGA